MSPRLFFLPVALLTVFAGYLGWKLGQPLSETALIDRVVAQYLDQSGEGARPSDCSATPGEQSGVRLVVTCRHRSGAVYVRQVGPRGAILPAAEGPAT